MEVSDSIGNRITVTFRRTQSVRRPAGLRRSPGRAEAACGAVHGPFGQTHLLGQYIQGLDMLPTPVLVLIGDECAARLMLLVDWWAFAWAALA